MTSSAQGQFRLSLPTCCPIIPSHVTVSFKLDRFLVHQAEYNQLSNRTHLIMAKLAFLGIFLYCVAALDVSAEQLSSGSDNHLLQNLTVIFLGNFNDKNWWLDQVPVSKP